MKHLQWQEWTPETIARAQREDKLIFLSVGYSACHWCHVLAAESFADKTTADIMNKYFVNIKVDREERPDVDRIYMTFLQATQGGGGWPLSVCELHLRTLPFTWPDFPPLGLTPTLEPVFAGTYYPRMQFRGLLDRISELWMEDRDKVLASGKSIIEQLKEINASEPSVSMGQSCLGTSADGACRLCARLSRSSLGRQSHASLLISNAATIQFTAASPNEVPNSPRQVRISSSCRGSQLIVKVMTRPPKQPRWDTG